MPIIAFRGLELAKKKFFLTFFMAKMTKIDILNPKLIVPDDYQQFWVHFDWFFIFHISLNDFYRGGFKSPSPYSMQIPEAPTCRVKIQAPKNVNIFSLEHHDKQRIQTIVLDNPNITHYLYHLKYQITLIVAIAPRSWPRLSSSSKSFYQ